MLTPKIGVLKDMYHQLEKYCVAARLDLKDWTHRSARFDNGDYVFTGEAVPFAVGERWRSGYDEAHFFSTSVTLPPELAGRELRLEFLIGGEALVRVNGSVRGSVSAARGAPERGTVILSERFAPGAKLDIELEAAVNSAEFCNPAMDGAKYLEYRFDTAYLWVADPECESYWYDIQAAFQAYEQIDDERVKALVYSAIDDSLHLVDYDFSEEDVRASIAEAGRLFNDRLAAIPWSANAEVIFTGHSHIDVAWLWRVQESIRKSARTFSNVTSLMDKYPEMTFGQSQAVLYQMVKDHYPEVFEKIKEKVRAGQWDICGNVWVEADTNIASGEALIRQVLYGTEFFKKEFGKVSDTYWLPDCFGFTWALPQIIKGCGMKYFITSKLSYNDTNYFPFSMFRWQGCDGTQVLAHLMRPAYIGKFTADEIKYSAHVVNNKEKLGTSIYMYGYGDGGGGPTNAMLERGRRFRSFPGLPKTRIGHVDDFFRITDMSREDLPVWNGEMFYENHRGTFTSQAFVKKNNRRGEYALERNEMLSVIAGALTGFDYPKERLETGWRILMTNQFHDILPGTSIHEVFEDCRREYAKLRELNASLRDEALEKLDSVLRIEGDSLVCWNLLGFGNSFPVTFKADPEKRAPLASDGRALPHCFFEKDGETFCVFTPEELPPMGVGIFRLGAGGYEGEAVTAKTDLLENEKLRVELDEDGIITSIYDKINGRETLEGRGNLLTVSLDKCVHETAWNLEINYRKKTWELVRADEIKVLESNCQRGVIEITRSFNKSVIRQKLILNRDSDVLLFDTEVDWHETDKVLKAAFEVNVIDTDATYDIAHGAIKRPTHWNTSFDYTRFEVAAHKWADLSEGDYGVSIINDCKYGYDIHNSRMRITLMRAPTCPDRTGDHGVSTFVYAYYPHKGSWQQADTVKNALSLNVPPLTSIRSANGGSVKSGTSFVSIEGGSLSVECVKQAQDGRGYILRLAEDAHSRGRATVSWALPGSRAIETNMIEEDGAEVAFADGKFSFDYRPYEVKTFRILP